MRVQGGGLNKSQRKVDEESLPAAALALQCPWLGPEDRMAGAQEDVWPPGRAGVRPLSRPPARAEAEVPARGDLQGEVSEVGGSVELLAVVRRPGQQLLEKEN